MYLPHQKMSQTNTPIPKWERVVQWDGHKVKLVDQRLLPHEFKILDYSSHHELAKAITMMVTRGACAIGAAGALGMVLAARASTTTDPTVFIDEMKKAKATMDAARPTAVNLSWATSLEYRLAESMLANNSPIQDIKEEMVLEALQIMEDDVRINKQIGAHGAALIKHGTNILHHCNTGRLASIDYGTALGVIYVAHEQGKNIHVWVDETRPRLQGATLTAFELMRSGVPFHLIPDSAAGMLMSQGKVDYVVYGADRVAANGDVVNKIGTYAISVCGNENNIPVYACVPTSTIDLQVKDGKHIEIEERSASEVLEVGGVLVAPKDCPVFNPAFDMTPSKYITAIITEEGVCYPPFEQSLREAKERGEKKIAQRNASVLAKL